MMMVRRSERMKKGRIGDESIRREDEVAGPVLESESGIGYESNK